MRSDAKTKTARIQQLEKLLLSHPEGLPAAEIARRLQVHRSTVGRDIEAFGDEIGMIQNDDGSYWIDRTYYRARLGLTLNEGMALHLAARLMATRSDKHNPHAASALRKLGESLRQFAPLVSRHLLGSADVMDGAQQRSDPTYLRVLETLTQAWAEGYMVRLKHRHTNGRLYEHTFATYFIEPYAIGQTTYVIGRREPQNEMRTFKIERIDFVERLPNHSYTIPDDFDPAAHLESAWGIWSTEQDPVEVVLHFTPQVARRVRESRWHPLEQVSSLPNGGLEWRAPIAEPKEMMPWIRSWGGDVEIIAPAHLRDQLQGEIHRLMRLYGISGSTPSIEDTFDSFFGD